MAWLRNLFSRLTGRRSGSRRQPPALPHRRHLQPALPPPPSPPRLPGPARFMLREPQVPMEPPVPREPLVQAEPALSFSEA
jgi:hypothetical protein